ncbi:putative lipopolysaccharide heptosyltransferase III [Candidatus Venteria ishoeyi]|uniref:Lipopolysaccharide core heptosyltransferase RfaQ n=1 Tax=Candidatus Venteria ishoeyi TaxID=1899563 RepID=A0A1H6FD58_9GAMM|nr:putative lipopolysaccharide heptosyltransferase III [Candidatus Venteria ishoeyi]MDM8546146.1 putative lipopolysaccharide heptosyltransferase III [Candidatus Venteria ishoeyi]SEH08012.1 Lipopolysaccharide core heptosyltransferase RfaQ [Candidatus Venteria ishoeyi]
MIPLTKPPKAAAKILIISTRQIGDVLLTTPLIHSVSRAYPKARIDMLVFTAKGSILSGNPDIQALIEVPERPKWRDWLRVIRRLWRHYDLAISTLSGDRPTLYAWLAAPLRIGLLPPKTRQSYWKYLIYQGWAVLDDKNTPTVLQNLQLAEVLGIQQHPRVIVPCQPDDNNRLTQQLDFNWQRDNFVVLHLTPMWRYKRWPLPAWSELARVLQKKGLEIVLTGGSDSKEQAYLQDFMNLYAGKVHNLAGKLSFSAVALLIKHARLYVGPDTAVTHLAAATGTPSIALFGPTNPVKWAPFPLLKDLAYQPFQRCSLLQQQGNVYLLQGEGDCVPCHQEGCDRHRESDSRCLQEMPAQRVINIVEQILNKNTSSLL